MGDGLQADFWPGIRFGQGRVRPRPRTFSHRLGQERVRISGMEKENPGLVLASNHWNPLGEMASVPSTRPSLCKP